MKKFTLQEIIKKANEVHNNFYSYDNAVFVNTKTPLTITCPNHGDFKLIVNTHLKGGGCSECRKVSYTQPKEKAGQEFIKKAREIHGDKYSYDKLEYVNNKQLVTITCSEHGDFEMKAEIHLRGSGCRECRNELSGTPNEEYRQRFIEKARQVHGDFYNYDNLVYIQSKINVTITCPKHGDFTVLPDVHLRGSKCKECLKEERKLPKEDKAQIFIEKAKKVHGDLYTYDNVVYVNSETPVRITCKKHGDFEMIPKTHIQGFKCQHCRFGGTVEERQERFIREAKEMHKERNYDYSRVKYVKKDVKVEIICPEHGLFLQTPNSHVLGDVCPVCAKKVSGFELWLKCLVEKATNKTAFKFVMKNRKHIDVLVDDIGFEANGLRFHCEVSLYGDVKPFDYHQNKTIQAASEGITLYHIFEDEYLLKREVVEAKICKLFGNHHLFKNSVSHTIEETAKETLDNFCNRFGFELFTDKPIRETASDFNVVVRESSNGDILLGVGLDGEKRVTAFVENPQYNIPQEIKKQVLDYIVEKIGDGITISIPITWFPKAEDTIFFDYGFVKETQIEPQFYYFSETIFNKRFFQGEELEQGCDFNKIWNCGYHKLKYNKTI